MSLKGQFMNCPYTILRLLYIRVGVIHELPHIRNFVSVDNFWGFSDCVFNLSILGLTFGFCVCHSLFMLCAKGCLWGVMV